VTGRTRFEHRYAVRTGIELTGYGAIGFSTVAFHEVSGNKPWFCSACGRRLPRRHLADSNSMYRLHLLGCGRDA
jgi:hypothetical protein